MEGSLVRVGLIHANGLTALKVETRHRSHDDSQNGGSRNHGNRWDGV